MRRFLLFAMWLIATGTAVGVAWAGVSVVDDQVDVTQESVGPLTASPATPSTTATTAHPSSSGPQPSLSTTTPTDRPPTSTSAPTSTPTSGSTSTTPVPPSEATAPSAKRTETFTLVGGTAAISFSSAGVEVLWATSQPGFDVSIEPESTGLKVEFRADHHRSRVDAWWSDGPQHSIREEPRNG